MSDNPCAICGESNPELFKIWFDGYLKLFKCMTCGFISQFPGPGKYTIITNYEARYSLEFLNNGQEFMYPKRRRALEDIVLRISKVRPDGSILDVGCGDGHFLYLCAKRGYDCIGVEDSKNLSEYAAEKSGAHVYQGRYNSEMFQNESFDIITFIQVLEHIPVPLNVLEAARKHLRPRGLIVIEVPSVSSPHFWGYRLSGIKWFVKPPDGVIVSHYGYYDPGSLLKLTEKSGFDTINIITGRWQYKYAGLLGAVGRVMDPIFDKTKIGGILYIGVKK